MTWLSPDIPAAAHGISGTAWLTRYGPVQVIRLKKVARIEDGPNCKKHAGDCREDHRYPKCKRVQLAVIDAHQFSGVGIVRDRAKTAQGSQRWVPWSERQRAGMPGPN
jgi:hypothetical protein